MTLPVAVLAARTVSWLGLQSASQPRLSYAEMAEDYPRFPDIHDLDLTLLNPRMIVVRGLSPRTAGKGRLWSVLAGVLSWLGRAGRRKLQLSFLCRMSPRT